MLTVREALSLALPSGTRVAGGGSGLGREVAWARVLRAQPPALEGVEGGDMALLSLEMLGLADDLLSPGTMVREMARLGVAAAAIVGEVPADLGAVADEEGLPLLSLPATASLRVVEKSVIGLVLNRRAELEQRGVQMYRQLAQCITTGKGLDAIVATLSEITGKAVALQDHSLRLKLSFAPPGIWPGHDELPALLEDPAWLGEWPQGHALVSTAPPIARFALPERGVARYSSQVIVYDYVVGYVSVLAPEEELTDIDRVAVGRAASVCAIEMAKEHAVVEAENRTRGELVDSLLANDPVGEEALTERAQSLGFDLNQPTVAVVFGYERGPRGEGTGTSERGTVGILREEIAAREPQALLKTRDTSVVAFLPLGPGEIDELPLERRANQNGTGLERVRRRVDGIRQHALRRLRGSLAVGIGRPGRGVAGVRKSYREAEQALSISQRLLGGNRTTSFDELRVYRLLLPLVGTGELRSFSEEVLGRLVEYDAKHSGELVKTLEVFFASDGNLQRAADTLYLHRNTLAYRLERIEEIAHVDLRDPDDRLCLQLALKIRGLD
jgi:purine catabolism regulator